MTCPDCTRLQEQNAQLHETINQLHETNTRLEQENTDLRRRLAAYNNPHTPPSKRIIYPKPQRHLDAPRYPGRPTGHRGNTRPKPTPDIILEPPRKLKCTCGSGLGEPSYVSSRVVEEINNPNKTGNRIPRIHL